MVKIKDQKMSDVINAFTEVTRTEGFDWHKSKQILLDIANKNRKDKDKLRMKDIVEHFN